MSYSYNHLHFVWEFPSITKFSGDTPAARVKPGDMWVYTQNLVKIGTTLNELQI
jgi:hypothetical protein